MRLFLATPAAEKQTWARAALEALYGSDLTVVPISLVRWDPLPERCLIESGELPTAELLGKLQLHGFKLLTVLRHPLDALIAHALHDAIQPASSPFFEYAISQAARDRLLIALAWAHVDGALVIRHENWAYSRAAEIERIRLHCGDFTPTNPVSSAPLAPDEEPDFWRAQLPLDTARAIHAAHSALFAALGYSPPVSIIPLDPTTEIPPETKRLRHQLLTLEGAHLRIAEELNELHEQRKKSVLKSRVLKATIEAQKSSTNHYHQLVHNAGIGKHLYRAWKVLTRDHHYRQASPKSPTPANNPSALPAHLRGYQTLTFGDLEVRFHLEALHDNRGTGRVARQLLAELQNLEKTFVAPALGSGSSRHVVHFFAAPHWGPAELPAHSCVIIHDVIPSLTPGYPAKQIAIFETRCRSVLQQADKIITISASSARDIARVLNYPEDKITVIHNGVTRLPITPAPCLKLPAAPFVAYVGGGDSHKNIDVVLKALRHPAARHVHLVMIGDNDNYVEEVESLGLLDRVHFLGRISDGDLGYVLQQSKALLFPSFYEGFGLPPLEAALLGTPSICSRRPAMTELLAGAALFANHESADDWAACIHLLTMSPGFAREIGCLAQTRAERLQWPATASAYLNALQAMA